jgi:hypothetical protein
MVLARRKALCRRPSVRIGSDTSARRHFIPPGALLSSTCAADRKTAAETVLFIAIKPTVSSARCTEGNRYIARLEAISAAHR